jgi:DMSO/TMAO reductase YedYZ heme-binding membrane subunit
MQNIIKKFKFLLLLIPLGVIIRYVDLEITKGGFLSTNEKSDHFVFIGGLVFLVIGLIVVVLYFDKKSNP